MVPHIFTSPMREKEQPFVSCLFYIIIFPKISLSLISLAGQEDNLRTAASENIYQVIPPMLDSPYIGIKVKPFFATHFEEKGKGTFMQNVPSQVQNES
jgi:hypothetical protein